MIYILYGKHQTRPWEEIDQAETRPEINYLLAEYRLAFGPGWQFKIKRMKNTTEETNPMTKKHFILLARAISTITNLEERTRVTNLIADVCAQSNTLFNYSKFLQACGVENDT